MNPQNAARNLIEKAFLWSKSRAHLRRLLDSKSAEKDPRYKKELEKAHKQLTADADELEKAVLLLEASMPRGKSKGQKKPLPWGSIFGAIESAAKLAGEAARGSGVSKVIDTVGETTIGSRKT